MRFKKTAFSVVSFVLAGLLAGLLIGEIFLALFWHEPKENLDRIQYNYVDIYDNLFKLQISKNGFVYKSQRKLSKNVVFPLLKGAKTKRIFIIGESIAFNLDEKELKRRWEQVLPSFNFEIINCGMGGYDSYRATLVGDEILGYKPDAIVMLIGNNDFSGISKINPFRYKGFLSHFRLYRLITDMFYPTYRVEDGDVNKYFYKNISTFVGRAKTKNIPVIICTIPDNYEDFPPVNTQPSLSNRQYFYARYYLECGKYVKSKKCLETLISKEANNSTYHYYLGTLFKRLNNCKDAKKEFMTVLDLDRWNRCSPARNDLIRKIASENTASLADIEKKLIDFAPNGLIGFDVFCDWCHVYPVVYGVFYKEIIDAVYRNKPDIIAEKSQWNIAANKPPDYEETIRLIEGEKKNDVSRQLYRAIDFAVNNCNTDFSDQVCAFMQDAYNTKHESIEDVAVYKDSCIAAFFSNKWAHSSAPRVNLFWDRVLLNAGETLRRQRKEKAAIKYFNDYISHNPANCEAYLFRGLAYYSDGQTDKARSDFNKVISLDSRYSWLKNFPE